MLWEMSAAYLVDAVRSPIGRRNGSLSEIRADELAAQVLNGLVGRVDLDPGEIEDVQMGCVTQVGEQALNVAPVVENGGGILVPDEELTGDRALTELMPLLTDPGRALEMGRRARLAGHGDADERMARIVLEVIGR